MLYFLDAREITFLCARILPIIIDAGCEFGSVSRFVLKSLNFSMFVKGAFEFDDYDSKCRYNRMN